MVPFECVKDGEDFGTLGDVSYEFPGSRLRVDGSFGILV